MDGWMDGWMRLTVMTWTGCVVSQHLQKSPSWWYAAKPGGEGPSAETQHAEEDQFINFLFLLYLTQRILSFIFKNLPVTVPVQTTLDFKFKSPFHSSGVLYLSEGFREV